jgi:hypothetical protein
MQLLDRPVQIIDLRLADRVVVRPKALPAVSDASDSMGGNAPDARKKHQ